MDPNLFHIDWERTAEALMLIIILAFVIERALAVVFENRIWLSRFDKPGLKELIAVGASIWVCFQWKFDAVGMTILTESTTVPGYVLTGLVIAGGSKASIKLFHDVLGMKSTALQQYDAARKAPVAAAMSRAAIRNTPSASTTTTTASAVKMTSVEVDSTSASG